jgi:hypothetical protein
MLFFQSSIFLKILSSFDKQLVYISYEKKPIDKKKQSLQTNFEYFKYANNTF